MIGLLSENIHNFESFSLRPQHSCDTKFGILVGLLKCEVQFEDGLCGP